MIPLSKSKIKYIKSLHLKKNRLQEGMFIVEGSKSVLEFLDSDYKVISVVGTEEFFNDLDTKLCPQPILANSRQLAQIGNFKSNNAALAIIQLIEHGDPYVEVNEILLALDGLNDPGNLGTIIRIADWFGIDKIVLSNNSVDVYNPKVVSASKGSLTRVRVFYSDLNKLFAGYQGQIYGAEMTGERLEEVASIKSGIILMGSETHGISTELSGHITKKITISGKGAAESLNVAVATGIICHRLVY